MKKYSFLKGFWKAVISIVLFAIPIFLTNFPAVADLTIGGVLVLLVNFIKFKVAK
jgi:hypothetical protein